MAQYFDSPKISVDVVAYNSKVYYVITKGPSLGDTVHRFPITGNDTVLDAIASIGGLSNLPSKKMWIARPAEHRGKQRILPIDWDGICERRRTETNYQLFPGDRLYIADNGDESAPPAPGLLSPAPAGPYVPHANAVQFDGWHYAKVEQQPAWHCYAKPEPPKFTSGDFTISLWFNPTTSGKCEMLFHRGFGYRDQPGDVDMHLNIYSGDLDFAARTADNQWLFGWDILESRLRSPVSYNQWNHAVATRRGKTYTMWMNGSGSPARSRPPTSPTPTTRIRSFWAGSWRITA